MTTKMEETQIKLNTVTAPKRLKMLEEEVPYTQVDKLVHAVQFGDFPFVETAITQYHMSPDTKDSQNCSLLHWAAINNRKQIAEFLILQHANVNIVGGDAEEIPLQWAVRYARCLPMVHLLINEKSNLNHRSKTNHDALFLAVISGQIHAAFMLLNANANPDTVDQYNDTPILWLLKNRNIKHDLDSLEIIRLLISFHADVSHAGKGGNNALHVLAPIMRDLNLHTALLLYESGKDRAVQGRNEFGKTPWQLAWSVKNLKLLRFFWDAYMYTKYPRELPIFVVAANLTFFFQSLQHFGWIFGVFVWAIFGACTEMINQATIPQGYSRVNCGLAWGIIFNAVSAYFFYIAQFHTRSFNLAVSFLVVVICVSLRTSMVTKPQHLVDKGIDARNALAEKILRAEPILNSNGEEVMRNFKLCTTCLVDKGQASIHCKNCNMCVVGLDHHCPFVNNCVGRGNRRAFVIFTGSASFGCALMAWQSIRAQYLQFCPVAAETASGWFTAFFSVEWCMLWDHPELRALTLITWMSALASMWIVGIFLSQVHMIAAETTTFEMLRKDNRGKPFCNARGCKNVTSFCATGNYTICETAGGDPASLKSIHEAAALRQSRQASPVLTNDHEHHHDHGAGGGFFGFGMQQQQSKCCSGHDHSHGHGHGHSHGHDQV